MPEDRLERILKELQSEVESRREEDQSRNARWLSNVLSHEHRKSEQRIAFTEMLRRGHGLGEDESEKND